MGPPLLPEFGVTRCSGFSRSIDLIPIAVMDRVVCTDRCGDEEFRIDKRWIPLENIDLCDWVHVVNDDSTMDLIALDTQIAAIVSDNNRIPNTDPLSRAVKALIDPSIEPKGGCSYDST